MPIPAGPDPGTPSASYATVAEYTDLIGGTIPSNLARLLRKASREIDRVIFSAWYDTTDAAVILALTEATCEQAAWMVANGWDISDGAAAINRNVSIGSVTLGATFGSSNGGGSVSELSPDAFIILQMAGLTGGAPLTEAGWY